MKERQLIGMVEYVLGKHGDNEDYAQFLNQPLTLGMFVPCDEDGNVYESEPQVLNTFTTGLQKLEYQAAKERVIFEGLNIKAVKREPFFGQVYYEIKEGENTFWVSWNKSKKVKDLIERSVTLTESTYNKYFK